MSTVTLDLRLVIRSFSSVPCVLCSHVRLCWGCGMMIWICWNIALGKGKVHKGARGGIQKCRLESGLPENRQLDAPTGRPEGSSQMGPRIKESSGQIIAEGSSQKDHSLEERPGKDHCERIVQETATTKRVNLNGRAGKLRRIVAKGSARTDVLMVLLRNVLTSRSLR